MSCLSCKALSQLSKGESSSGVWLPLVGIAGLAVVAGVLWSVRDRCPDVYDDYVVGVRTHDDRLRTQALREGRQMNCSWASRARR